MRATIAGVPSIDDACGRQRWARDLAALAERQHGVVELTQFGAFGLGPRGVQHRAAKGHVHRIHRTV